MSYRIRRAGMVLALTIGALGAGVAPARAADRLCDPSNEDCRAILINYIRAETVGIDVGFWFMEDARYTAELIRRFQAGVPVRVIMDVRANASRTRSTRSASPSCRPPASRCGSVPPAASCTTR